MKNNVIVVFDFETGSLDIEKCEVIQVAAMAIDRKKLEPIPNAVFESLIKPRDFNNLQDEALAINKKTKEKIEFFCKQQLAEQEYMKNCIKKPSDFSNWHYGANGKFKFA